MPVLNPYLDDSPLSLAGMLPLDTVHASPHVSHCLWHQRATHEAVLIQIQNMAMHGDLRR